MNRKRILGITALLAVIAMGLTLTACPPADEEERVVIFRNASAADFMIICTGSTPSSFPLLAPASLVADATEQKVTRKGADIVINTITITRPEFLPTNDVGDYIAIDADALPGEKKAKNGLSLSAGTITFRNATGQDFVKFKVSQLDE